MLHNKSARFHINSAISLQWGLALGFVHLNAGPLANVTLHPTGPALDGTAHPAVLLDMRSVRFGDTL